MNIPKISDAEMEIAKIVWDASAPVTTNEIMERLPKKNAWKLTTVLTLAKRLNDKGILCCSRHGKINYYSPLISQEEYKQSQTVLFLNEMHGGSVKSFLSALSGGRNLSHGEVEELRDWLKEV